RRDAPGPGSAPAGRAEDPGPPGPRGQPADHGGQPAAVRAGHDQAPHRPARRPPGPARRSPAPAARPSPGRLRGYVRPMITAGFVAPYLLDTTARFVQAAASLPDTKLALITTE